jgi:hypothetical protein
VFLRATLSVVLELLQDHVLGRAERDGSPDSGLYDADRRNRLSLNSVSSATMKSTFSPDDG